MTRYIKQYPYHIIRAIRSIGSIAKNATYFYVAQFLALVITLSAIGGTNELCSDSRSTSACSSRSTSSSCSSLPARS